MTELNLELLARTLGSLDTGKGISAQTVFMRTARAMGLKIKPRNVDNLRQCLPTIRALVDEGIIEYWDSETTPRYTVREGAAAVAYCRTTPEGAIVRTRNNAGNGRRALELMSIRPFYVSRETVEQEAATCKAELEILPQTWADGILRGDAYASRKATLEDRLAQCKALLALPECAVYFDTAADFRGRLYFGGGRASPHNGKFARRAYAQAGEVTLDCRSSFAQMISLLTGDAALGRACGIGTDADCDLYLQVAEQAGIAREKAKAHRDALKHAIMPRAYGAGENRTKEALAGAFDDAEQIAILKRLDAFTRVCKRAQAAAAEFADDGDQLQWATPCGNRPQQEYWLQKSKSFCTGDNERLYYPASMALTIGTQYVQRDRTEFSSGAVVGATANVVQSLDASLCADVICEFYDETGVVPFTVHDSFTVPREHEQTLRRIVCEVMKSMYDAPEMQELRRMLKIVPPRAGLDFSKMNPLDIE